MPRVTLKSQQEHIEMLEARLAQARSVSYDEAPLCDVSTALLNRLENLKNEQQDAIDDLEAQVNKVERAYDEADSADDRIRELNLDD